MNTAAVQNLRDYGIFGYFVDCCGTDDAIFIKFFPVVRLASLDINKPGA
jgi:hypothetical protein